MQRSLEKAVARASLADDRDLAGRIRDEGQRLVFLLNGLVRSSRLYQAGNAAIDGLAAETSQLLKGLVAMLGIPPFVITLGMMVIARGLAMILTDGSGVSPMGNSLKPMGEDYLSPLLTYVAVAGVMAVKNELRITAEIRTPMGE